MKSSIDNRESSILAVHPGALGDVILFGRLLELLQGGKEQAVTLVSGVQKARLLAGLGVVGRTLDFDSLPMQEIFGAAPRGGRTLGDIVGRHSRLISCFGGGDAGAESRLAAACGARDAAYLPIRPPPGWAGHLVELWCDMLGLPLPAAGFASWPAPPAWLDQARIELQKVDVPSPAKLRRSGVDPSRGFALLHVGAGARDKCWPLENFVTLARQIAAAPARPQVAMILGLVEIERMGAATVRQLAAEFPVLVEPPLEVLAGALAQCWAYVGNDSGVSHLAGAMGAPCLVLFGPTNPRHFSPLGPRVRTISAAAMSEISVTRAAGEMGAMER